ncbi:MAG TPA: glutamate racemase [Prevotellaceae bacterium]|nr:glutamate racemase [Prevotellaceae bacterium]
MKSLRLPELPGPIGVFDSGYGGLTILKELRRKLPEYDYLYLGDNARAPYGTRSFDIIYHYTLEAVTALFHQGCHLVILACNTASAKALRTIQQKNLPKIDSHRRVLGVIRPTAECIGPLTHTRHIGILATTGTINSKSYEMEIKKLHPDIHVEGLACPMWVPLVENFELDGAGTDYFVKKSLEELMEKDHNIDTIILGCTHYPLLLPLIQKHLSSKIKVIAQGEYIASSLQEYLHRHPEMADKCTRDGTCHYLTTENNIIFDHSACRFMQHDVQSQHIELTY